MHSNEEYVEINLKDLFFQILYKWKPILIVAIIVALLLGSVQATLEFIAMQDTTNDNDYYLELQRYEDQLALYENRVKSTQNKIDITQEYLDQNILMNTDYLNVYIAKATYYIDSDYKIMPESNYQNPDKTHTLVWYYKNFLDDYGVYQTIGEAIDMEAKNLMELVSITVPNNNTLSIEVSHPTEQYASLIMDALKEQLDQVYEYLNNTIDDHTLTIMLDTCGAYVDESLRERQQELYDEMLTYQDMLITQKDDLEQLEKDAPSNPNVMKKFLLWAVVGGVIGAAMMAVVYACIFIFTGKVSSQKDLASRYSFPVLGSVMNDGCNPDKITRIIRNLEGRVNENSLENNRYLAMNLKNHSIDGVNLLLCSDGGIHKSQQIVKKIQEYLPEKTLHAAGSLTTDANALQILPTCDAVVMVVTLEQSRYETVNKTVQIIQDSGKKFAGFIWMD